MAINSYVGMGDLFWQTLVSFAMWKLAEFCIKKNLMELYNHDPEYSVLLLDNRALENENSERKINVEVM